MNYTELKRLAEAATAGPWKVKDRKVVTTEDAAICCSPVFRIGAYKQSMANTEYFAAASPDVVLSMIAEIDRLRCDVEVLQRLHDEDGIEHNKLRTQNQALLDALEDATDEIESWGAYASEYFQEKHDLAGNVAKFRAIAQAEGDETFGLSMSMFANQRDYQDEKNRRLRARLDFQEGGV